MSIDYGGRVIRVEGLDEDISYIGEHVIEIIPLSANGIEISQSKTNFLLTILDPCEPPTVTIPTQTGVLYSLGNIK